MASQEGISKDQTVASGTDERLATQTIGETLERMKECSLFLELIRKADMQHLLRVSGLRTLFAPRNDALRDVAAEDAEELVNKHVASGSMETFDLRRAKTVQNAAGEKLAVEAKDGTFRVGSASIVRSDIACTNGVIHVVDAVIS